jgi:hypothetical protein
MSINAQSRYQLGTITRMPNSTGTYNLTALRSIQAITTSYSLYVWKAGDRADLVAYRLLGNPSLWWSIFDINPELINPLNVPAGTLVRIPRGTVMGQGTLIQ